MFPVDRRWRVSVATFNRVVFQNPHDETIMLALERKATLIEDRVSVLAQPFGGAVRIVNPAALRSLIGDFIYDSERSESERDFRLLIQPSAWQVVQQVCLQHLSDPNDPLLESTPERELAEEFVDTLTMKLESDQYEYRPVGFVIEGQPTPTDNPHGRGFPTVRLYRTYEVWIRDVRLCNRMLTESKRYSDRELQQRALDNARNGGRGRANGILTLPLTLITDSYRTRLPEDRYRLLTVADHQLDPSVLAILDSVEVPQFHRL